MERPRILPILCLDGKKLVKTVQFKQPKYIGDPINALKIFNDKMVDEILVLDITASKNSKGPNFDYLKDLASECFSPLGYGGGIRNLNDARKVFECGVEKVVLNSAVVDNPDLVTEIANVYGSQSVVVSIDIKKTLFGGEHAFTHSGTKRVKTPILEWAKQLEAKGAGEFIVQSIDRDGTFKGLHRSLTQRIAQAVQVPVVAAGGSASVDDMLATLAETGASAAAAGSIFVYRGNNTSSILISYPTPKDILKTH